MEAKLCSIIEFEQALAAKEEKIAQLQQRTLHPLVVTPLVLTDDASVSTVPPVAGPRRGRAPPISLFSGEDQELRFVDWLPGLERAGKGWEMEWVDK